VLLYYPKPFRVRIKGTVFAKESPYAFMLQGENGSFLQQRSDLQETKLIEGVKPSVETWIPTPEGFDGLLHTTINGEDVKKETRSEIGNYMNYYEAVYNALRNNRHNPVPASDAILTMKVIDAALQSSKDRKVIPLEH